MRRYRRIIAYARPHWRPLGVVLGTMVVSIGFDLLKPWPMKILIDNVLGGKAPSAWLANAVSWLPGSSVQQELLWLAAGGTVVIFIGLTLVSMVNTYASTALGQRMTFDLASDLFLHIQRLSLIFHSRRPVGDMLARVTGDSYCAQTLVNGAVIPVVQSVTTLIGMFVVMWTLQPALTLLSVAVVPFLLVTIRVFGGTMKDRSRERRDLEGRMVSIVHQTLTAMPAVQAFTREGLEHGRFRGFADRTVVAYLKASVAAMWFRLFAGLVTAVGTAAIMYAGGRLALEGKLTAGTIIVFLSYLTAMYGPLTAIAYTAETVQTAAAEADRILEVFDIEPDVVDRPDARDVTLRGAVRFEDVTFGYEAGRAAVRDVSFTASPGEVVAIVGPTGAGKTTIVNLLPRFFDPWAGTVSIDGHDVRDVRLESLRGQIALVLQEPFIFPLTVAENIAYGRPDAPREAIEDAARAANAHDFIMRLPEGYDALVGERGGTLSGGERQRLSIARAFLKDAPILILDEPTSALDAATESALLGALGRLMRGRVTLIIAHRLSTIRNADEILVVDAGRIVERGDHRTLLVRGGLYASLYAHQMEVTDHEAAAGNGNGNGNGHGPAGASVVERIGTWAGRRRRR